VFSDRLQGAEVERTRDAIANLAKVAWARPVIARLNKAGGVRPENMPLMFEVRFADDLHSAGATAQYEFPAGVGQSTVEFRLDTKPVWLVELVSIRLSMAARRDTREIAPLFEEQLFRWTPEDPGRSEESEMITAEQKIAEKVVSGGRPTKFPPLDGSLRLILADMRGYLDRGGDIADYREMAYGYRGLQESADWQFLMHHWQRADDNFEPVKGLFEQSNPIAAANLIRERIHFLGFIREKRFYGGEIRDRALLLANPHLFANQGEAISAYATFPLARLASLSLLGHRELQAEGARSRRTQSATAGRLPRR